MELTALLNELATRMGLDGLCLDSNGICRLVFDKTIVVDLEPSPDNTRLHIVATLGQVPADASAQWLRSLLVAGFMGQETGGAHVALDPLNDEVVLCQRLALDGLEITRFVPELEAFVNHAQTWMRKLADDAEAPSIPPSIPAATSLGTAAFQQFA